MWVEKHGKPWRIRDRIGGELVTLSPPGGYPTKTSATMAMRLLEADQLRGEALVPRGGQITLNGFIDEWWPSYERSLKPSSQHSEGARVRNHIRPLLGHLTLDECDGIAVQQWVDNLGAGIGAWPAGTKGKRRPLAPKTVHNCHGLLFKIMSAAIHPHRRIKLNPCAGTNLPLREHHEMMFLTDPEIARLITHVPPHWRPLVMLLVATGLRWGEAVGLRCGRVDLLAVRPKLLVVECLHEMPSTGEIVFTDPKSRASRRTVSFTRQAALALTPLVVDKGPDDLLFTSPQGKPVRVRNFRRGWVKWVEAAGLPGLRAHDLRHTHAAILIAAGRSMYAISRRLGHSSEAITSTLYGHLREEVDEGILAAIEEAMSQIRTEDLEAEVADELGAGWEQPARSIPEQPGPARSRTHVTA